LGKNGVEQIIEISLTNDERAALQKSAGAVQELIDVLGTNPVGATACRPPTFKFNQYE